MQYTHGTYRYLGVRQWHPLFHFQHQYQSQKPFVHPLILISQPLSPIASHSELFPAAPTPPTFILRIQTPSFHAPPYRPLHPAPTPPPHRIAQVPFPDPTVPPSSPTIQSLS